VVEAHRHVGRHKLVAGRLKGRQAGAGRHV
jgi:hypothetical protein